MFFEHHRAKLSQDLFCVNFFNTFLEFLMHCMHAVHSVGKCCRRKFGADRRVFKNKFFFKLPIAHVYICVRVVKGLAISLKFLIIMRQHTLHTYV